MKKLISLTSIFVLFFQLSTVFAQENKISLGLEAGPSLTWSHGSEGLEEMTNPDNRIFCGLSFQYNFNSVFSLHSGLAYEQKGHTMKFLAVDNFGQVIGDADAIAKFSYLTVPIMLRTSFGKKLKYFVNAGPFVGLSLNHKVEVKVPDKLELVEDYTNSFKATDLGISAGAGVIYPISPVLNISLEVRDNLGLLDIDKMQSPEAGPYKTNSLNLLFGISYEFGETAQPAE